ncbi:MAG: hypothetical protein M3Z01_01395 [Thermoproteota archaeon]|nr:hypothetical protein [Thermoproteota archaeon]
MVRDFSDNVSLLLVIILSIQLINKIKGEENDSNLVQSSSSSQTFKIISTF